LVTAVKNTVIYDVIADNAPVYILHLTVTVTLLLLGLIAALADAPYCYRRSSVVCHDRHPKTAQLSVMHSYLAPFFVKANRRAAIIEKSLIEAHFKERS